ncbi:sugar ABC transporter permease [Loigolactobacillus coryniformis]|jgi:raffinose/stachyose/melibiose transport system permease protein|uniref:Multiple sugar-binding transport system permease n=3 Tax=Loigolactobacillus coryniformis TaxID=1610 RepID=A0A0R1FC83_9LACO|nr:sugar ABC transporter permease [Loigolactobacillus coryniformis]MDT3391438.1 sugar ABC transporter permease [Bacillota bacterium]OEH89458.1 ABC transporter permease [Loigolactobacillus coryniformis subsp. coryniformis]RRG05924.1 MAG: sugar ABC transporter permease [Lactobacillus sp.]ATO44657.1 ABC transporter permease [Loigolactobacillus coryniformis subsp. torquens DSM 20004 = KCTC 3535]ATO56434.1 ABC transporter permease [Loigolactobacillus coryniformis subsp. coryniformis KCTC 3167 = DSM
MKNRSLSFWLFLTPTLVALSLVVIIPVIMGLFYSFTNWDGIAFTEMVGFKNYLSLFQDHDFINAFWFTVKFVITTVILLNAIGLSLALLVTQKLKTSNFLRTIFFMPNMIGGLILGFIWQFIFTQAFTALGNALHLSWLQNWLTNETTGFWGLVIVTVWQMSGYIMIIYIAYLQNIPQEVIEAAEMDGASAWQRFTKITFPMIAPAFTVCMFLTLSNGFKIYDQNLSLTNGGPYKSTQMLALDIVNTAYNAGNFALAEAKSIIFFLIVAAISLLQVYYNRKREVKL